MRKLFAQEEEISASFPEKNTELSAHKNLMKFHLQSLLSKPRNGKLFPANREEIGGFIFREMAKSGLLIKSEEFLYKKVTVDNNYEVIILIALLRKNLVLYFWSWKSSLCCHKTVKITLRAP